MARTVVRNSFGRNTVEAVRVRVVALTCTNCGQQRRSAYRLWLYRFEVNPDAGRRSVVANGALFCSRSCAETYLDQPFDETKGR